MQIHATIAKTGPVYFRAFVRHLQLHLVIASWQVWTLWSMRSFQSLRSSEDSLWMSMFWNQYRMKLDFSRCLVKISFMRQFELCHRSFFFISHINEMVPKVYHNKMNWILRYYNYNMKTVGIKRNFLAGIHIRQTPKLCWVKQSQNWKFHFITSFVITTHALTTLNMKIIENKYCIYSCSVFYSKLKYRNYKEWFCFI